jgi:hypothetical protein
VDRRDCLDDVQRRKFLTLPGLKLRPLFVQPIASHYTDYAIPALKRRRLENRPTSSRVYMKTELILECAVYMNHSCLEAFTFLCKTVTYAMVTPFSVPHTCT